MAADVNKQIQEAVARALERLRTRVVVAVEGSGRTMSSETKESLTIEPSAQGGTLRGALFPEIREAGPVPDDFTDTIRQWIIDKGISIKTLPYKDDTSDKRQLKYTPEERGLQSMASVLAFKIATEGSSLQMREESEAVVQQPLAETENELREEISNIIETEIGNIWQSLKK